MNGNVFSQWLKELCALVFTQSVQAFILAIILTLIAMTFNSTKGEIEGITQQTQTQATGVLAIVALTSISKMEDLVKQLFGLNSRITDTSMKGGRSLVRDMMQLKALKAVTNNAKKITSGIGNRRQAKLDMKKADLSFNKAKIAAHKKENNRLADEAANSATTTTTSGSTTTTAASGATSGAASTANGNGAGSGSGSNGGTVNASSLNISGGNITITNSNLKVDEKNGNKKEKSTLNDDLEKAKEEYENKKEEIKAKRRAANKEIRSGILETGGAIAGGAAGLSMGAVIAAGTGENILQGSLRGGLSGAGLADKAISTIVDAKYNNSTYKKELKKVNEKLAKTEQELRRFDAGDI